MTSFVSLHPPTASEGLAFLSHLQGAITASDRSYRDSWQVLEASEPGRKHLMKVCIYADKGRTMTKVACHGGDIHSHQEAVEKMALSGRGGPTASRVRKAGHQIR